MPEDYQLDPIWLRLLHSKIEQWEPIRIFTSITNDSIQKMKLQLQVFAQLALF